MIFTSMFGVFLSLFSASRAPCKTSTLKIISLTEIPHLLLALGNEEVPRRLWAYGEKDHLEDTWEDCNAEEVGPALVSAQQVVDAQHLAGQQAHGHCQLVHRAQPAPQVERGDLGYVHRHQGGVEAAVDPDQVSADDEQLVGGDVLGEDHGHGGDDADEVVHQKAALPPKLVGNPPSCA